MKGTLTAAVAMASGFIALSYEILWYRAYAFVSQSRPAVFGILLAFYLFGIAVGANMTKRFCVDTNAAERTRSLRVIAAFVIIASLVSYFVIPVTARLATVDILGVPGWGFSLALVALGAAMMGSVLPLVAHFGIDADDRAGLELGYVYLANIIGSTCGSLLTGFVLMELASTRVISVGLATAGFAMALLLILASGTRGKSLLHWTGMVAGGLGLVAATSGFVFEQIYERFLKGPQFTPDHHFVDIVENRHGVIAVDTDDNVYGGGVYDGAFSVSLSNENGNRIERAFAVGVMHPHPKELLLIGLASGSWAQALADLPGVEHFTIVEIDPGYLPLIAKRPVVASLLTNPKVEIIIDDGRRWMLRHPERKFDAIVMNTTWHWRAHAANLLSREFLQLSRAHLAPGGIAYYNTTNSKSVLRTGATEFPYAFRFENFLVVSDSPISFGRDAWREELTIASYDGKRVLDLTRPSDQEILERFVSVLDAPPEKWASVEWRDDILKRTEGSRIVTDDNMACEWESD